MPHTNNITKATKTYSFGDTDLTNRGYTGHEHLPDYQLINMNGRMYDPITKQMTSPDIFDQSTYFTQSYNRYSYGLNNPMSYTDLSGYVEIGHRASWPTPTGTAGGSSIDDWGSCAFMQQMYSYNPMDDYYFMVTNESASGVGTGSILDLIIATGGSAQGDGGHKEGDEDNSQSTEVANTLDNVSFGFQSLSASSMGFRFGMFKSRLLMNPMSKIGTFNIFSKDVKLLGLSSKYFGNIAIGFSFGSSTYQFATHEIGAPRYLFRSGMLGTSMYLGRSIGGAEGFALGTLVGFIGMGAEYSYDNVLVPLYNTTLIGLNSMENSLMNGTWYPGRY